MRQAIGDLLLRRLQESGIKHIFGVPGDYNLAFTQQLDPMVAGCREADSTGEPVGSQAMAAKD